MILLIVAAVVLCALVAWCVVHLGGDGVQALLAVGMMTIAWHLLRRPGRSLADDFGHW